MRSQFGKRDPTLIGSALLIFAHDGKLFAEMTDAGDAPIPISDLDFVRATLVQMPNDDGLNSGCPVPNRWTGGTILQISGATRKKLGMVAVTVPRQVAKAHKKNIKSIKKDKDKNRVSERALDLQQRELFQVAKVIQVRILC